MLMLAALTAAPVAAQVPDTVRPPELPRSRPPRVDSFTGILPGISAGNPINSITSPDSFSRASAPSRYAFRSFADSIDWERNRRLAARSTGFRVIVSLLDREVLAIRDVDTLLRAPAAVASGMTLDYAGRTWTFRTPRGRHTVVGKAADPVWRPPDWVYAEAALEHGLELARWPASGGVRLRDGSRLVVRDSLVGVLYPDQPFQPLPVEEHIVFGDTLYIPPFGTLNRRVPGELGSFALDLGDGYLIHGTPHLTSIGMAVTHGCIRLHAEDIAWLYVNVPRGTPVFIF